MAQSRSRLWILVVIVLLGGGALYLWATTGSAPASPPASTGIPAAATEATVEYVHDGDTLFLEDGRKVRLLGIDTPEVGENLECYGDEARELLRQLLPEGAQVRVLADIEPLDRFDRSLLFIYQDDGTLVNLEMIEQGAAETLVIEPNVLFERDLEAAEDSARSASLGMWGACRR